MASLAKFSRPLSTLRKLNTTMNTLGELKYPDSLPTSEAIILNVPPTKLTTLPNGLRIASEDWGSQTATVGVWIDAGSRYENNINNGVAHFMEHMAFKGTSKRTQSQLEIEIEDLGAQLNAYTSREQTVYYAKCLSKDVPRAMEIISDIIQNAKLGHPEIERERGVILREMQEVESNLQEVVFDHLHSTAFQGTPLANTILGPPANIKTINANDLKNYLNNHYKAERVVVAGAGGINHDVLVKLTEEYFSSLNNNYTKGVPSIVPSRFTGSEIRVRNDCIPLAHLAFCVEGAGWTDADTLTLMVAATILGAWDRSQASGRQNTTQLAKTCVERDLCHSFQSFNTCYKDTGLWGIYFISEPQYIWPMLYNVQKELKRLCIHVKEDEVERAKALFTANTLLQLDNTSAVCEDIGRQILCYGRRIPPHELKYRIDSITVNNVRQVCEKYFYDRSPAIAGVGPVDMLPKYKRVRSQMYWLKC